MTDLVHLRRTVAATALVLALGGCSSSAAFIAACDGIRPGTTFEEVDARMRAVGGHETFVGEGYFWQRETLFAHDACEVEFDRRDRVVSAQYWNWR